MLDPHSSCPTLGHARLMASIKARWEQRNTLEGQTAQVLAELDALLTQACDQWPLRLIEDETGVPRSTANGRVLRYRARPAGSEAAA